MSGCVPASVRKTPGVVGRVVNSQTGKPVAGAQVGFVGLSSGKDVTDRDGRFSIAPTNKFGILVLLPFDPAQRYLPFEVLRDGFRPLRTEVPFYDFGNPHTIELSLDPLK